MLGGVETTNATRWTIWLSLAAVSGTAAVASYLHALAVVQAADGDTVVAYFIAALADPAIFAASVNILDASRRGLSLPKWSIVSIVLAIAVTLGANIMAGSPRSVPPWLVNVWPPVAFLMALESLMSFIRRGRTPAPAGKKPVCIHQVPPGASQQEQVVTAFLHGRDCTGVEPKWRELGRAFDIHHNTARKLVAAGLTASTNGDGPHGGT